MKKFFTTIVLLILLIPLAAAQGNMKLNRNNDSLVVAALAMVDADSLQSYVLDLQSMGTRFMISPNRREVANWIMDKFISFGITEVRLDSFLCNTTINIPPIVADTVTMQYNVEAKIQGLTVPDDEIVVIGHYDDATQDADPMVFAPGADDNASGTAAVLECARVIMEMEYQPDQTMIFLASGAEELMYYGFSGTEYYAAEALADGRNIVMAINNDMIAWNDGSWTLDLFNHILSPHITELAIEIIENHTSLNYMSWQPDYNVGGDIQPFLDAGYYGIYLMEHYINPNYHSVYDLADNCDFLYLAEATKVSLGCMMQSDITVGDKEMDMDLAKISIYPNPAAEAIYFKITGKDHLSWQLKIHDMNGKAVYQQNCKTGNDGVDISFLPDGFYFMTFTNGETTLFEKLIIAHN